MVDPVSAVSGGVTIAQGLWSFISWIRGVAGADVLSAYFRWDGSRILGSNRIEVEKHAPSEEIWWYSVKDCEVFVFVRQAGHTRADWQNQGGVEP